MSDESGQGRDERHHAEHHQEGKPKRRRRQKERGQEHQSEVVNRSEREPDNVGGIRNLGVEWHNVGSPGEPGVDGESGDDGNYDERDPEWPGPVCRTDQQSGRG
jgi:hypothetical protein